MGGESVGRSRRRDAEPWREAKRRGGVVRGVVWCGMARCVAVGGRAGGWRWYRFLCLREIQNDGYKPPRHVACSLSPSLSLLYYLSVSRLSFSFSRSPSFSLSFSLILRSFSTHSPRIVHEVVTLVYTTARDHTRPCARYTRTRAFHTNEPTVQPHLAYRRGGGGGGERG